MLRFEGDQTITSRSRDSPILDIIEFFFLSFESKENEVGVELFNAAIATTGGCFSFLLSL